MPSFDPLRHPAPAPATAAKGGSSRNTVLFITATVVSVGIAMVNVLGHSVTITQELTSIQKSLEEFVQPATSFSADVPVPVLHVPDEADHDNFDSPATTTLTGRTSRPQTLAKLSCEKYGGPANAQEMVYWHHLPSDQRYVSPLRDENKYMTFEPDGGGWNNIRMAMETVLGLAVATGRTLVLPPEQRMYLLAKGRGKHKTDFSFADFFPMHELAAENEGLDIITMKEFLERMHGKMRDKNSGQISYPPGNRTDWDGQDVKQLKEWLRNVTLTPLWSPGRCMAAFPSTGDPADAENLQHMMDNMTHFREPMTDDPIPVDSAPWQRLRDNISGRKELCIYDSQMQAAPVVHFMCYHKMRVRMLVHFYAFLFLESWKEDLWMKRFMRDHVRYNDDIQCAAARIVDALRNHRPNSTQFDSFHIRRGDFQYKATRIEAAKIYENTKEHLTPGSLIYIATDERKKEFFDDLKKHYEVLFMDDFKHLLEGVNMNHYGMIDQLVASRGRRFFGCWHSTFTGFIHRMRGYHSVNDHAFGYEKGLLPLSFYYTPTQKATAMHKYARLHGAFYVREFPLLTYVTLRGNWLWRWKRPG